MISVKGEKRMPRNGFCYFVSPSKSYGKDDFIKCDTIEEIIQILEFEPADDHEEYIIYKAEISGIVTRKYEYKPD